tara:strand:- start:4182 stop:4874 length:693 start_codon:yes stop_codon:yes gene_type:complete
MVLLHYTGMSSGAAALARLCDPAAKVSAHYLIDLDGTVHQLVAEEKRAWHAGVSSWSGERDINSCAMGIELVNKGHDAPEYGYHGDYHHFTDAQMTALIPLLQTLKSRYDIEDRFILAHSDVAPARRKDPGEKFDWSRLAAEGVGLWPDVVSAQGPSLRPGESGPAVEDLQRKLAAFGYGLRVSGFYDDTTEAVVTAFQRHFVPDQMTGIAAALTQARLEQLLDLAGIEQ